MSSCFGNSFRLSLFGQSHGSAVGVTLDGFPAGMEIDMEDVLHQMARRAPGQSALTTPRKESDAPEIISGYFRGKTTGQPLTCLIRSQNTRSQDYGEQVDLPRPGHADYTGHVRYFGFEDFRGGGHFSARLTAPLVFAGALCRQYFAAQGVQVACHIQQLGSICDKSFLDPVAAGDTPFAELPKQTLPTLRPELAAQMEEAILAAKAEQDSIGGVVECRVTGLPAGLGAPFFDSVESVLSHLMFSIPAVKGERVVTVTDNCGGVLGGITTGGDVIFRCVIRATPSIGKPQQTVSLVRGENAELSIHGRHDPCVLPRAVPVVEAMTLIGLMELWKERAACVR